MSENLRVCKRCLLVKSGKEDILSDIKSRVEKLKPNEKADEKVYAQRLEVCKNCDFLEEGTCLKCGCYPEFRGAFKDNKCPVKKW